MRKVSELFCRGCGAKMVVEDVDSDRGVIDIYYQCPKCNTSLIRKESYKAVEYVWFDGDTQIETTFTERKYRG